MSILFENKTCRLTVGENGVAESLIYLPTGEECLLPDAAVPLFSSTQDRPFNNEVKLAHPNTRTTYPCNHIRQDGNRLIVGFDVAPYEAVVEVGVTDTYITFTLVDFLIDPEDYDSLSMTPPPVTEFRVLQLSVKNRKNFGEWLNVSWDENAGVCVLAVNPETAISAEPRSGYRVMAADGLRSMRLRGAKAALVVGNPTELMDGIDRLECDFDLPKGVQSRRSGVINSSIYFSSNLTPANVDEHIAMAKKAGFRMMQLYYTCIFKERHSYSLLGNYEYRDEYPNGRADLEKMLKKLEDAGITVGLHVLQTHIGLESHYVTPVADHRLNLTRHFTLAKPLSETDTEIFVEQNPIDTVMADKVRVLMFGGELISYEGYTTEWPYRFFGCVRGAYNTNIIPHPVGQIGGILDISEFGATSTYLDQNCSMADEIAEKIADAYNAGFKFLYFDGSEGVNPPCGIHVAGSQYRVLKKLNREPLFTEGAAKSHFSWHFLGGGNAFDVFAPEEFKARIVQHPAEEAPRMQQDFTQLNFGWWDYRLPSETTFGTQADLIEYGSSRAAAWDCPASVKMPLEKVASHPRTEDILETLRRWEDVRHEHPLTTEQKRMLQDLKTEHHLLINESGAFELLPWRQIPTGFRELRAFLFERNGQRWVAYWHISGSCETALELPGEAALYREPAQGRIPLKKENGKWILPVSDRHYFVTDASEQDVLSAFAAATPV